MSWLDSLVRSTPITSIYPHPPLLQSVRMHEVRLAQDGPTLFLSFDLRSYPEQPPSKWLRSGFNCVQLTLMLMGVTHLEINGWGLNNVGDLDLRTVGSEVRLQFTATNSIITCHAPWADVQRISAYHNESKSTDSHDDPT